MTDYIIIRVKRPDDYEDVCAELVAEDFIASAMLGTWEWSASDDVQSEED